MAFLLLCAGSTITAAGFEWSGSGAYEFLLGGLSPSAVTAAVCLLGMLSLGSLNRRGWLRITDTGRPGYGTIVTVGAALTAPVIVVDWLGGFHESLNVPWPASLLFYPAIALVAACAFHALPVGVVAWLWPRQSVERERSVLLVAMGGASLIEPVLQVAWGAGQSPGWANAYVGFHLLLFNVLGLYVFRRRGFLAAYVFRLAYYSIWHVAWGHARLEVLFGGGP